MNDFIGQLFTFSQNALSILSDFGQDMLAFLSREFGVGPYSFTIFEIIFGAGFAIYFGARLYSHLADIVIPN